MRAAIFITLAAFVSCQPRSSSASRAPADSLESTHLTPGNATDSVLLTPRVISGRTVLVFWLSAADTLPVPDQASALDELTYYTERIAPTLARHEIALLPTNAETVYVALPNRERRPIVLSGADYPFGYLFVEPGTPERMLAGVYGEDELLDELEAYFDLPPSPDSTAARPRVST
jgi:hypothetical protein